MDAHEVVLRLEGYQDASVDRIELIPDSTVTKIAYMRKRTGNVTLRSHPSAAEIYVNGGQVDQHTPHVLSLEYGEHDIVFRKDGYLPCTVAVEVSSQDHVVDEELVKLPPGTLEVRVVPYADIWIDGKLMEEQKSHGEFPGLDQGWHEIRLIHPKFPPQTMSVYIQSNEVTKVSHEFEP
jgi:hypothetical protein